jgi:hypothetical protein
MPNPHIGRIVMSGTPPNHTYHIVNEDGDDITVPPRGTAIWQNENPALVIGLKLEFEDDTVARPTDPLNPYECSPVRGTITLEHRVTHRRAICKKWEKGDEIPYRAFVVSEGAVELSRPKEVFGPSGQGSPGEVEECLKRLEELLKGSECYGLIQHFISGGGSIEEIQKCVEALDLGEREREYVRRCIRALMADKPKIKVSQ